MPKSKFALGKATEYKVASIFLDADCEVYLPAVDDHGVDMLVIPPKNLNDMLSLPPEVAQELYKAGQSGILEVQVKSLSTGGLLPPSPVQILVPITSTCSTSAQSKRIGLSHLWTLSRLQARTARHARTHSSTR